MRRRLLFFIGWIAFILYAVIIAPDGDQGYLQQLVRMDDPDPTLLAVFSFLGIYPMVFASLLLGADDAPLPLWPFVAGMFVFGAFALMPYFFLTKGESVRPQRTPAWLLSLLQSRILLILLFIGTVALAGYGGVQGDIYVYLEAFRTSQFVHVMTVDFLVLTLLSIYVINWREHKEGHRHSIHWIGAIPIAGALFYLIQKKK